MTSCRYAWLVWSGAFFFPWLALYLALPGDRDASLWASPSTTPFGLTEIPIVLESWSPPSLFDLARRTGSDMVSLTFCFGIGGMGAALAVWRRPDLLWSTDRASPPATEGRGP